jgi:hypothetical protein
MPAQISSSHFSWPRTLEADWLVRCGKLDTRTELIIFRFSRSRNSAQSAIATKRCMLATHKSASRFSPFDSRAHLVYAYYRMYTFGVIFTWDEPKRQANLAKHGLDFADAEKVFAGPMVLFEDNRADYASSA